MSLVVGEDVFPKFIILQKTPTPPYPEPGSIWFDVSDGIIYSYDGTSIQPWGGGGLGAIIETEGPVIFTGTSGNLLYVPYTVVFPLLLYKNGQYLSARNRDYSITGADITLAVAAEPEDYFEAVYAHQ